MTSSSGMTQRAGMTPRGSWINEVAEVSLSDVLILRRTYLTKNMTQFI